MSNLVFPTLPGLGWSRKRTPLWNTLVQEHASGVETRITSWTFPRWRYALTYELLREDNANAELRQLAGFFNQVRGRYDSWLFSDPDDGSVINEVFGVGNGTATAFQLTRVLGGYAEPVTDVNGVATIKKAGVTMTPGADYTIGSTGIVTFTSAPVSGDQLSWTGSFYWRCRFTRDETEFEQFMTDLWLARTVEFITLKRGS